MDTNRELATSEVIERGIDSLDKVGELMDRRGVTQLITILVVAFIAYILWRSYNDWRKFNTQKIEDNREFQKQKLLDEMETQKCREQTELDLKKDLISTLNALSGTVGVNAQSIYDANQKLDAHSETSKKHFEVVNEKLDTINDKMEIATDTTNEEVTREMLEDIKTDIKSIENLIRGTERGNHDE